MHAVIFRDRRARGPNRHRLGLLLPVLAVAALPAVARAQVPAGGEFTANTYTTGNQFYGSVAHDRAGNFTVVWTNDSPQDGSGRGVFGQRFASSGARVGGEFQVNTYTTGLQAYPALAFAPNRSFVVVWASAQDGSGRGMVAQRFDARGSRIGSELLVNTYTTGNQFPGTVAADAGGFTVVWSDAARDGSGPGMGGQRFDWSGNRVGAEFTANTYTTSYQRFGSVGSDPSGNFVVVWTGYGQDGSADGVFGQRFDSTGGKVGTEFQLNTYTTGNQFSPGIAVKGDGSFVVTWVGQDGYGFGVLARRFDASGNAQGTEFVVNTFTNYGQRDPWVGSDAMGNFAVNWRGSDGNSDGSLGQRFTPAGVARGAEFLVNTYTTGQQRNNNMAPSVSVDEVGNLAIVWHSFEAQDGNGASVQVRRFGGLRPAALAVDTGANRVWEPGETVDVRPTWQNLNGAAQPFAGTLGSLTGPAGASYAITDGAGDYGSVANGASQQCIDCYGVSVSSPPVRPAAHWDATAVESITPDTQGQQKIWRLHVGGSFTDVPASNVFYRFVETLLHQAVTGGCTPTSYCPSSSTTREQMAVFVLVAREGAGYAPPACSPPNIFDDVPETSPFCRWVEELFNRGVVAGCGGGNYCPAELVSREQMAVFVLRTLDPALSPPACAPPNLFDDVPETSPFCRWVEELANRGVVTGCSTSPPLYCPSGPVSREQMGVFISVTFGLALYGP